MRQVQVPFDTTSGRIAECSDLTRAVHYLGLCRRRLRFLARLFRRGVRDYQNVVVVGKNIEQLEALQRECFDLPSRLVRNQFWRGFRPLRLTFCTEQVFLRTGTSAPFDFFFFLFPPSVLVEISTERTIFAVDKIPACLFDQMLQFQPSGACPQCRGKMEFVDQMFICLSCGFCIDKRPKNKRKRQQCEFSNKRLKH